MIKFHILIANKISQIVFMEFFESVLSKKRKNSRCPVYYIENSPDEELFQFYRKLYKNREKSFFWLILEKKKNSKILFILWEIEKAM